MKLVRVGGCVHSPINQNPFPEVPTDRNKVLYVFGSKWNHAEEEWIVTILSIFAVKNQGWCAVQWKDLVKIAKRKYKNQLDNELYIGITIANMVKTGDLMIVNNIKDKKFYIVPRPILGKTIAESGHGWVYMK